MGVMRTSTGTDEIGEAAAPIDAPGRAASPSTTERVAARDGTELLVRRWQPAGHRTSVHSVCTYAR